MLKRLRARANWVCFALGQSHQALSAVNASKTININVASNVIPVDLGSFVNRGASNWVCFAAKRPRTRVRPMSHVYRGTNGRRRAAPGHWGGS
jgi:hypothetical protein